MKKKFFSATIALLFITAANAQTNVRQENQEKRTENGVQSGELTNREQNV